MTLAELTRLVDSKERIAKLEAKEQAANNYVHALLIGKVILSAFDSNVTVPKIHEVYPTLFQETPVDTDLIIEQRDMLSALRFRQFAQSFNNKFSQKEQDK